MGRYLDLPGVGDADNPLQGLSLDGSLSPSLATATNPVAAIDGTSYDLWAPGVWNEVEGMMFDAASNIGQASQALIRQRPREGGAGRRTSRSSCAPTSSRSASRT